MSSNALLFALCLFTLPFTTMAGDCSTESCNGLAWNGVGSQSNVQSNNIVGLVNKVELLCYHFFIFLSYTSYVFHCSLFLFLFLMHASYSLILSRFALSSGCLPKRFVEYNICLTLCCARLNCLGVLCVCQVSSIRGM